MHTEKVLSEYLLFKPNLDCIHTFQIYLSPNGNLFGVKLIHSYFLFTIFSLIWNQTDLRLVPNQPENGKYNLISA